VKHWVTTPDVDRVNEILLPKGGDSSQAHTVFWGHDYDKVLGSLMWQQPKKKGVLAKTQFAKDSFSEEKWQQVKEGHLRTWSVGYIPTQSYWQGYNDDFEKIAEKVQAQYPDIDVSAAKIITTKWIELEYSLVGVPMNPNAVNLAIQKGLWTNEDIVASSGSDAAEPPVNEIADKQIQHKRVIVSLDTPSTRQIEVIQSEPVITTLESERSIAQKVLAEIDVMRGVV
jgi:hypothetical protein